MAVSHGSLSLNKKEHRDDALFAWLFFSSLIYSVFYSVFLLNIIYSFDFRLTKYGKVYIMQDYIDNLIVFHLECLNESLPL